LVEAKGIVVINSTSSYKIANENFVKWRVGIMVVENAAFNELMKLAGWSGRYDDEVTITRHDPVLPTYFHAGEMTAGIHAACGVAISKLWELKTGRRQQVAIDVRAATATLLSFMYLKLNGEELSRQQPTQTRTYSPGFQKTRDGRWFFVHNYGSQKVLKLLGCEKNPESVPDAVASWDAQSLEDATAEAGLCGAFARSGEEWAKHPQGITLKKLPVVEVIKIGNSPPEPLPPGGNQPLSGIRVLDLTVILAGPTCARTLAEHGADVLKIGSPGRQDGPMFDMETGHGKRSTFLDLQKANDKEKLWSLIREADVFSQSYRYGALNSMGFSPEAVAKARPGIIYTSVNCYGHEGPWRERRGWEQLAQTVSGVAYEEGDGILELVHAAVDDFPTGYEAAFGTLIALERRAHEGGSYLVRVSLTQNAMWLHRLGRVTREKWQGLDRYMPAEEIGRLSIDTNTPWGRLNHMAPVLKLSETPPHWKLPAVPLGTHQPVWLDR
jgi:crotonobetainyl-CoA:carnitine CoA-transferase CaiB-like acyl-CoA transferase